MQYRKLGNTGLEVSALGFGAMRLPKGPDNKVDQETSVALFQRAYELGVNYFDSAYMYDNGDSERAIGRFLADVPREKVIITTKNPVGHDWWKIPGDRPTGQVCRDCLEEDLERLNTDYIDNYLFHSTFLMTFRTVVNTPNGPLEEARKAKQEGLINHIGISCHDIPDNMIKIIESAEGAIEMVVLQYNLLDRKNEVVIDYARENGIGIAVMGPVGGGRLIHPSKLYQDALGAKNTVEAALRFVLSNPGVSTAMSGMNALEQVEQNVEIASRAEPLTDEEKVAIDRLQEENEELLDLYCTGCNYCMPCPHGINIPENFTALNLLRVHAMPDLAKEKYQGLGEAAAEYCEECGTCAGRCPQHIDIQERLKEVAEALQAL